LCHLCGIMEHMNGGERSIKVEKRYDKARIEINPKYGKPIIRDMKTGQYLPKYRKGVQ